MFLAAALELLWFAHLGHASLALALALIPLSGLPVALMVIVARWVWCLADETYDLRHWGDRNAVLTTLIVGLAYAATIVGSCMGLVAASDVIATPSLRAFAVALGSVLITCAAAITAPAALARARGFCRERVRDLPLFALLLVLLAAGTVVAWPALEFATALPARLWFTVACPIVAGLAPLVLLRRFKADRRHAQRTLIGVLIAVTAGMWFATQRRGVRHLASVSGLQSRAIAGLLGRARNVTPGARERLFPPRTPHAALAEPRHVVLITIDAMRADSGVDSELMPRLNALAATRFEASCTAPSTQRALASILTGRYADRLDWRASFPATFRGGDTLAELLQGNGMRTVFAPHTNLVVHQGTMQGFDHVLDPPRSAGTDTLGRRDSDMVARTLGFLGSAAFRGGLPTGTPERLFLWSHFYDPHWPYDAPELDGGTRRARYDREIAAADRALGELLDGLDELGFLHETLLIVTSDHGEEFGLHGVTGHSTTLYSEALRVPLLFMLPSQPHAQSVEGLVSHIDIYPTVLELLGLEAKVDGRSLVASLSTGEPPPERTLISGIYDNSQRPLGFAGLRANHRLETDSHGNAIALFDTADDPDELGNLVDDRPELVNLLEGDVARYRREVDGNSRH